MTTKRARRPGSVCERSSPGSTGFAEAREHAPAVDREQRHVDRPVARRRHVDGRRRLDQRLAAVQRERGHRRGTALGAPPRRREIARAAPRGVGALEQGHVHVVAGPADRVRQTELRVGGLRAPVREAPHQLQVELGQLEQPGAADRMAARLEPARQVHRAGAARAAPRMCVGILRRVRAARAADQRLERLLRAAQAQVDQVHGQEAVEGVVRLDDQALERARIHDARPGRARMPPRAGSRRASRARPGRAGTTCPSPRPGPPPAPAAAGR